MVDEGMPGVVTVPAGVPFLEALAAGLLAESDGDAQALADALVLLPTRRACRLLAEAFLRRSAGGALLLPRFQPLGEVGPDEVLLEGGLDLALPPVIGSLRRQWLLARLFERSHWQATHALRLATELAGLLDELQTERVPVDALARLVPAPLAEHWQKNQQVLAVIAEVWPEVLAAEGALDPAERRHRLLSELAARWRAAPPQGRVVAAGSTGSIPATRTLLGAIAALPGGTVVLPGLDQAMDEASWLRLDPGHPQHGLKQLLEALNVERTAVGSWPAPGVVGTDPARARLLGEVMRPAATIAAWQRGPRLAGGLGGVLAEPGRAERRARGDEPRRQHLARLVTFVQRLERASRSFVELARKSTVGLEALLRAHLEFAETLAEGKLWAREAGEAAASLCTQLLDAVGADRIAPTAYPAVLAQLMAARPVRSRAPKHPRLHIWGQLEARLQHADLLLLGGLSEGTWPALADPGPWLSGAMREALGLTPVERRIGLAAHDFVEAACAQDVVLSRAEKDAQGNPTVPCRWLVRLETLLAGAGVEHAGGTDWGAWAGVLDQVPTARPDPRPAPSPPLEARPRGLSVSDVGLWMKDPYDLYAKRTLGLAPLEALEADPGALERGNVIHKVLERFVRAFPDALPADAERRLLDLGRELFEEFSHRPQVMALWWPRFERIAAWVVEQERA